MLFFGVARFLVSFQSLTSSDYFRWTPILGAILFLVARPWIPQNWPFWGSAWAIDGLKRRSANNDAERYQNHSPRSSLSRVLAVAQDCVLVLLFLPGFLWSSLNFCWFLWISLDIFGFIWISLDLFDCFVFIFMFDLVFLDFPMTFAKFPLLPPLSPPSFSPFLQVSFCFCPLGRSMF